MKDVRKLVVLKVLETGVEKRKVEMRKESRKLWEKEGGFWSGVMWDEVFYEMEKQGLINVRREGIKITENGEKRVRQYFGSISEKGKKVLSKTDFKKVMKKFVDGYDERTRKYQEGRRKYRDRLWKELFGDTEQEMRGEKA